MHAEPLHLLATLKRCNLAEFATTPADLRDFMAYTRELLLQHRFSIVSEASHFFGASAATGVFCLAESHLTFHSWPEDGLVYLDLFGCGRHQDLKTHILAVVETLARAVFKAEEHTLSWVER